MKTITPKHTKEQDAAFTLVPAKSIARSLSCTPRYVHLLYSEGRIPGHRIGKACIRFNQNKVFAALGIETEAAASAGASE